MRTETKRTTGKVRRHRTRTNPAMSDDPSVARMTMTMKTVGEKRSEDSGTATATTGGGKRRMTKSAAGGRKIGPVGKAAMWIVGGMTRIGSGATKIRTGPVMARRRGRGMGSGTETERGIEKGIGTGIERRIGRKGRTETVSVGRAGGMDEWGAGGGVRSWGGVCVCVD